MYANSTPFWRRFVALLRPWDVSAGSHGRSGILLGHSVEAIGTPYSTGTGSIDGYRRDGGVVNPTGYGYG